MPRKPRATKERRFAIGPKDALVFDAKVTVRVRYPRGAKPKVVKTK